MSHFLQKTQKSRHITTRAELGVNGLKSAMSRVKYWPMKVRHIAIIMLIPVIFTAGLSYGFKQGVENYSALEQVLVSYILTAQAHRLKSGTQDDLAKLEDFLLMEISAGLDSYIRYRDDGNHIL